MKEEEEEEEGSSCGYDEVQYLQVARRWGDWGLEIDSGRTEKEHKARAANDTVLYSRLDGRRWGWTAGVNLD
jgi:hypothetical protein